MSFSFRLAFSFFVFYLLTSCALATGAQDVAPSPSARPSPAAASGGSVPTARPRTVWFDPAVPPQAREEFKKAGWAETASPSDASVRLLPSASGETMWVYALAAPFPTLTDSVTLEEFLAIWRGEGKRVLLMEESTRRALTVVFGPPDERAVWLVEREKLLERAWEERAWAVTPFEQLQPRWKVLTVEGQSPLWNAFDAETYPLRVYFRCEGDCEAAPLLASNRDAEKLTTVIMTGVTAMVRATADRMEKKGVLYPGEVLRETFRQADILHISNEIAFAEGCPPPQANATRRLVFCSDPKYIALLEDMGVDVIELTGNHFADWGMKATYLTTSMYRERGIPYFGGGDNLEEARRPLLIEHHGNRIAFIGCNPVGPDFALATDDRPGAAPCDFEYMSAEIARLKSDGYLVIATFQYHEYYSPDARPWQMRDFRRLAEAGAAIVSGSQAHLSQAMEFFGDSFIHYGLGNLFFDQMNYVKADGTVLPDTRDEFFDRHVFYDGRYINIELLTARLEDYCRPRWMTEAERRAFLTRIWAFTDWSSGLAFSPAIVRMTPMPPLP